MRAMNLLDQAVHKAWTLREQQIESITTQARLNQQWFFEVLATAKEAISSNAASLLLPKTPCLKKRKLNPEENNTEEQALEPAKKPRKLKRNPNDSKRKLSKSRRASRKSSTRVSKQPVRSSSRLTRASAKKINVDCNDSHQPVEICISEGSNKQDQNGLMSESISNTTQSFCEHEADIVNILLVEENKHALRIGGTSSTPKSMKDDIKDSEVPAAGKPDSHLAKSPVPKCIANDLTPVQNRIDEEPARNCDPIESEANDESVIHQSANNNSKKYMLNSHKEEDNNVQSQPMDPKKSQIKPLASNIKKQENCHKPSPSVAIANTNSPADQCLGSKEPYQKQESLNSPSMPIHQAHISRIKERLFEKICSPDAKNLNLSMKQGTKGKSPARIKNTPELSRSPATKRNIVCSIYNDNKAERSMKEGAEKHVVNENFDAEPDNNEIEIAEQNKDQPINVAEENINPDEKNKGPKIFKPIKPKNIMTGVHSMIQSANQRNDVLQGPVAKQNNIVTGVFSFIKPNTASKAETVEERKKRLEEDVKQREETRKKLVKQAEQRRQKEIDDRKKRRQEREQRVADAQAKKAQEEEERIKLAQERFELLKKNEERARKQKEKEEEMKKKIREKKMAEAEAKRRNEDNERKAKIAEKEEDERRKAEFLQRKHEYEEQERKRKIEEQKKLEELRLDQCAKERLLHEERIRREIEEREQQQQKRLDEKLRKEKEEREIQEKKRIEKENHEREEQERIKHEIETQERAQREKERREEQNREKERKEKEAREAYYKKKLEQKRQAEQKRTFDKAELHNKQTAMSSNSQMHAPQIPAKVQCTSYKTPTLSKAKSKVDKTKPPSLTTYDIENLTEDDSTDDEEDPAQEIPSWAKGENLKMAVIRQIKSELDPYDIFVNMLEAPKLEKMFPKLRARFFKRTSSACWDHPPRPFKTML